MILGVIPARAGSKGIENKNIYPLCGKPLIEYTIEAAVKSNLYGLVVSTDSCEICDICDFKNVAYYWRDENLCKDNTPMLPVIKNAVDTFEYYNMKKVDAVMILQPTSPLRTTEDINKAIDLYNTAQDHDSLYSGYYIGIKQKEPYDKHKVKPHFQRNGAIFITSRHLLDQDKLWSDNAIEYVMPTYRSIDIDTMEDMKHAELLIKGGALNPKEVL